MGRSAAVSVACQTVPATVDGSDGMAIVAPAGKAALVSTYPYIASSVNDTLTLTFFPESSPVRS